MAQIKVTTVSAGNQPVVTSVESGITVQDLLINQNFTTVFTPSDVEDVLAGDAVLSLNGELITNPEEIRLTGEESVLILINRRYYGASGPDVDFLSKLRQAINESDWDKLNEFNPELGRHISMLRSKYYNWRRNDDSRRALFDCLTEHGFIVDTYDVFKTKFRISNETIEDRHCQSLCWYGTDSSLADLCFSLVEKEFISPPPAYGSSEMSKSAAAHKAFDVFSFEHKKSQRTLSARFSARKKDNGYRKSAIYKSIAKYFYSMEPQEPAEDS